MLHEILLALSGHPSALLDAHRLQNPQHVTATPIALLSPPEAALLSSLGRLSRLHRRTRGHVTRLAAAHSSTICRAVATAIASHHLDQFQRQVLDVEARILRHDASAVGAYNIVPLATIVAEFSAWTKLMEWLWGISIFIAPEAPSEDSQKPASGAALIDRLRTEAQTGYPDIGAAALYLGKVAETSWLRQLSTWLLYGRLPSFGAADFFIHLDSEEDLSFVVHHSLLPKFVTHQTAASLLFIGKSLNQIRSLPSSSTTLDRSTASISELELLPVHVGHLSAVSAPIPPAKLSEAVANIRLSLSRNFLQYLLPPEKIVEVLTLLHQFFLLGRGEFAVALIAEADSKIQSRHLAPRSKPSHGVQRILLKEAEINITLSRSWSVLSSLSSNDEHTDDILDLAIDAVHLSAQSSSSQRPGTPGRAKESATALPVVSNVTFNDLLLSVPTSLSMDIRSPLDLFMTRADLDVYSSINAYLLATRRAHLHLAQLWKHSSIRREYPPPPNYEYSNSARGKAILKRRRQRIESRSRDMRKVWATCSAAIFFLAESEAYFHGEVVQESFKHFLQWVILPSTPSGRLDQNSNSQLPTDGKQHHDPEVLSLAHRHFLGSITYSLLLTDLNFTKSLREFFSHVDELVAFITRLQSIHQHLDLEEDDGVEDFVKNYKQEEMDVSKELDRARKRLDSDLKGLVGRLREIDGERVGVGMRGARHEADYEPLTVGGVDRLLMKLDWGGEGDEEEVVNLL